MLALRTLNAIVYASLCVKLLVIACACSSPTLFAQSSDTKLESSYSELLEHFQQQEYAQVIATVEQLPMAGSPTVADLQSIYLGAESYFAIGNYDRSKTYFEFWMSNSATKSSLSQLKPYCKLRLAQIHAKLDETTTALTLLNEILSEEVDSKVQASASLQKAWLLAEANANSSEANALCDLCLQETLAGSYDQLSAKLLKAVLLQHQANYSRAAELLMDIRASSDESKAMLELRYKASLLLLQVNQALSDSSLNASLINELKRANPPSQRLLELGKLEVLMVRAEKDLDAADITELELLGLKAQDPQTRQRALLRLIRLPDASHSVSMRTKWCKQLLEMKQVAPAIRSEVTVRYAKALQSQGDLTMAADTLFEINKSIELNDPWRPAAILLLAETSYQDERFAVAKDAYLKVLDLQISASAQIRFLATMRLGEMAAISNDWTLADQYASDLRAATDMFGYDAPANYLFGRIAVAKGEIDQARVVLIRAIEKASFKEDEVAARAQWLIGETYMLQSQYENAIAAYQAVFKYHLLNQWCALSHLQAAKCFEQLSKWDEAISTYEMLLAKYPESIHLEEAKSRLAALSQFIEPRMTESTTNTTR